MADGWESISEIENVVIPPKVINKWEGEDEDDNVKESWEEEEVEKKDEEKIKEEVVKINDVKTKKNKKLETNAEIIDNDVDLEIMTEEEKVAHKLKLLQIEKEADLKTAMDTFGVTESPGGIDGMHPTNKAEFFEFAQAISNKISLYKNADEFIGFMEELLRNLCASLNATDLKKIKLTVDNMHLEKLKIEKEKQKMEKEKQKKSSGKNKTKVKLRVEEESVRSNNIGDYEYDYDYDDDFM